MILINSMIYKTGVNGEHINLELSSQAKPDKKKKCVPFVSEYTNCNDDNICSGCSRCTCTSEGEWTCSDVNECHEDGAEWDMEEEANTIFDNALRMLEHQMEKKKLTSIQQSSHPNVPDPKTRVQHDTLLETVKDYRVDEFYSNLARPKRSVTTKVNKHSKRSVDKTSHSKQAKALNTNNNNTIKFFDAIDELNEDTLKDSNVTGTVVAKKMDMIPHLSASRRSGDADSNNTTLHIEYNHPKSYTQITDNKIDPIEQENKFDASHENLKSVLGNYSQSVKDKDLSKIVVNELKKGKEVIGDATAPVTSNITFTPENDTLTAMAFIAGNLLNKLWNMEKDASASSMETDALKHEKITDLLDLFKEPLNIRQETFLKNALEQLSSAIDKEKDAKNISICDHINEASKILYEGNNTSSEEYKPKATTKIPCKKSKTKEQIEIKQKKATVKAISKINNVLDLIRKFENIQGSLSELKRGPKLDFFNNQTKKAPITRSGNKQATDTVLTMEERNSLNLFGNLLEKITKLLMPKKSNKKLVNALKSQHLLAGSEANLKKKFKNMYNIDLTNMTVTAKDKMILDYLTHVEGNPDCLLNDNSNKNREILPTLEGNILLNLSEFFKLKSFSDLIKLLEPEKHNTLRTPLVTAKQGVETTTVFNRKKIPTDYKDVDSNKFNSTKEKLKAHLKTIIEDLIELQNAKGVSINGNIKIADALPCIYNVLNAGREQIVATPKEENVDPMDKIKNIFDGLKKEFKISQSRRSVGDIMTPRSKSAVIWERIIKNLNSPPNSNSRRLLRNKAPKKSYAKIKQMMNIMENGSSTYKHYALLVKIPPSGKLMLLKALEQDVQHTINIINDIKASFDDLTKLPPEKFLEIREFIGNLATGVNLSEKVNDKLKPELRKFLPNEINSSNKISKLKLKKKPILRYSESQSGESDGVRISRIQLMNQLIKNRMTKFIKLKENTDFDVDMNMAYNIAQRILYYLDTGNFKIANELYKVFLMQQQAALTTNVAKSDAKNDKYFVSTTPKLNDIPMRRMASHQKEFEDPIVRKAKHMNWVNQDHLIKQLLNIKSMGL